MLAILIIILVLIWAAVVWSIYSNFMVFYSNFSETENYHKAYYASISALERAELVIKQRQPWYVWSWGFILWTWQGSLPYWWSDGSLSGFSYFWSNKEQTSVFRDINSRTTRIPANWKWDVERMLAATGSDGSQNYNMMDYENAEIFLLYNDKSSGNPYNKVYSVLENNSILNPVNLSKLEWKIRLPKLLSGFWGLDTGNALVGNGTLPNDDAIVDWQIRWYSNNKQFTIYSTQSFDFWGNEVKIKKEEDSVFRESDINAGLNFKFWNSNWSPFDNNRWSNSHTIIWEWEAEVSELQGLWDVLKKNNWVFSTNIRFSLLNLLQTKTNNIYPFLEYYIDFWNSKVPDKYWTIDAEWVYKDYKVNMIIKKPTVKETVFWSFTSIF